MIVKSSANARAITVLSRRLYPWASDSLIFLRTGLIARRNSTGESVSPWNTPFSNGKVLVVYKVDLTHARMFLYAFAMYLITGIGICAISNERTRRSCLTDPKAFFKVEPYAVQGVLGSTRMSQRVLQNN